MSECLVEAEWPDVWSEYGRVFARLGMDEFRARTVVERTVQAAVAARTRPDPDRVADALKEFIVRDEEVHSLAGERAERTTADLLACLQLAGSDLRGLGSQLARHDHAVRKFGTAAEDLGVDVLIQLADWVAPTVCNRFVSWWDGEYEGNCELPKGHEPPHYDGESWFNDDSEEVHPEVSDTPT